MNPNDYFCVVAEMHIYKISGTMHICPWVFSIVRRGKFINVEHHLKEICTHKIDILVFPHPWAVPDTVLPRSSDVQQTSDINTVRNPTTTSKLQICGEG